MRRERPAVKIRVALPAALVLVACAGALSASGSGAAARASARPCSPQGYGLEQRALPRRTQHEKEVSLTAGWLTAVEHRQSCLLQTTVRVTVVDSGGVEARGRWRVSTVLQPWSAVVHTWVWRNWCHRGSSVRVEFSLPSGKHVAQRVADRPTCVDKTAPTTLVALGTGTKYVPRPGDRIPPQLLPPGTPPPLPQALIEVNNGWIVSDGYTLVAVYAGTAGNDASRGRFAIIHQNLIFGVQYEPPDIVDIPNAGALEITGWPNGAAAETSAQHGELAFDSANGPKGVLDLKGDQIHLISSG